MGASPSAPAAASPSPSRVTVWRASTILHVSGPITSTTRRRTVLLPTSIAQRRMPIDERPAGSRRGGAGVHPRDVISPLGGGCVFGLPPLPSPGGAPPWAGAPPPCSISSKFPLPPPLFR